MLIEFDWDGRQGHGAQRSSTSQLQEALNTTPQTTIPLWTGSERENDASVSSAKKTQSSTSGAVAVAGKKGRIRKEGRTASEDTFSVRWIGQICILRSRDRLADRPSDRAAAIDQPRRRRNIIQLLNGLAAAAEEPLLRYFAFVVRTRTLGSKSGLRRNKGKHLTQPSIEKAQRLAETAVKRCEYLFAWGFLNTVSTDFFNLSTNP